MNIKIALGSSAFNNRIKQQSLTIDELYDKLSKPIIRNKKDGDFFIFASFKENIRNAENVKKYYGTTLDFDDTTLSINKIRRMFKKFSYCIHTTYRHKAINKGNRFRLVLPYKRPITAEQNSMVTTELMRQIGAKNVDDSSKAMSRLMYLPSCPRGRKKYFEFHRNDKENYFDAKKLLENLDGETGPDIDHNNIKVRLSPAEQWARNEYLDNDKATFKTIGEAEVGNRNEYIYSYACSCFGKGYVFDKTVMLCKDKNNKFKKPLPLKEIITTIESIYKRHKKKNDLQDYNDLVNKIDGSKNIKVEFPIFIKMIVNSRDVLKESELQSLITLLSKKTEIPVKSIKSSIKDEESIQLDDQKQEAEEIFKKNIHIFDNYVYMSCDDRVIDLHKPIQYKTDAFSKKMAPLTKGLKGVPADLVKFLVGHKLMKEADLFEFRPDIEEKFFKNELGVNCVNSYLKPDLTPRPGNIKPVLKHFEYLIPNSVERNHFLDYIAYLVQHPGKKIRWVIILKGAKRIGKSFIADVILNPILGENNISTVKSKNLIGKFNAWQDKTQLAVCHELKLVSDYGNQSKADLTDNLKSYITDKTVEIELKGKDTKQVRNNSNLIAFTNHEDVISISQDEQRYFMLRAGLIRPLSREYYNNLAKWVEENPDKILNYFLNRNLSNFDPYGAPSSSYTNEIKKTSATWPEWVVQEGLIDTDSIFNQFNVITWYNIVSYVIRISVENGMDVDMMQSLYNAKSKSGNKLFKAIRENGFEYWKGKNELNYIFIKGKKEIVYKTPIGNAEKQKPSKAEVRKMIIDQSVVYDFADIVE